MHAGGGVAFERFLHERREVGDEATRAVGHGDGGSAIGDDVALRGQALVARADLVEEVVDRRLDAVRAGLADEDDGVARQQLVEEVGALLGQVPLAVPARQDFRVEHRIVLGQRVVALDLDAVFGRARVGVEQPRLVHHAGQHVAGAAQQAMLGPDVELVLAGTLELGAVVLALLEKPVVVGQAQAVDQVGMRPPGARLHVVERDGRVWLGRPVVAVEPERGEEDLQWIMRVHGRRDRGNAPEVAVDQPGHAVVVVERAAATASTDVEAALRKAEVALLVDYDELDRHAVVGRRRDAVLGAPGARGLEEGPLVGAVGPVGRVGRIVMARQLHPRLLFAQSRCRSDS